MDLLSLVSSFSRRVWLKLRPRHKRPLRDRDCIRYYNPYGHGVDRGDCVPWLFRVTSDRPLYLVGDFNDWDVAELSKVPDSDDYAAYVFLPPGTYHYMYVDRDTLPHRGRRAFLLRKPCVRQVRVTPRSYRRNRTENAQPGHRTINLRCYSPIEKLV